MRVLSFWCHSAPASVCTSDAIISYYLAWLFLLPFLQDMHLLLIFCTTILWITAVTLFVTYWPTLLLVYCRSLDLSSWLMEWAVLPCMSLFVSAMITSSGKLSVLRVIQLQSKVCNRADHLSNISITHEKFLSNWTIYNTLTLQML